MFRSYVIMTRYMRVFFFFNNASTEEDIRDEVISLVKEKESCIHDFSGIGHNDFVFIKCVNRRLRVPDGKGVYDGEGLKSLYKSRSIYIRLTKSFVKHKVSMISLLLLLHFTVHLLAQGC